MRAWVAVVMAAMTGCTAGDGFDGEVDNDDGANGPDPREVVTLRFQADWTRLDGLSVLFQDADSRIVSATTTDAAGVASARMQPGGFVSLVLRNGEVFTYTDVRAGDELVVDARASATGERATIEVSLPQSPGADVYVLSSTCGESVLGEPTPDGPPLTATLFGCHGETDVVVTTRDFEPGGTWQYLYQSTVTIDPTTPLVLTGEYQPMVQTNVFATGIDPAAEKLAITQTLVRDQLSVTDPRGTTVTLMGSNSVDAAISRMYVPKGGTTLTRIAPAVSDSFGMQTTLAWGESEVETSIDLGREPLRPFTSAPALDRETRQVAWTEDIGAPGDLVFFEIAWRIDNRAYDWHVLSPRREGTVVRYPLLPASMLVVPDDARLAQFATIAVSDESQARTSLLGGWPGNDARFAEGESGRADIQTMIVNHATK